MESVSVIIPCFNSQSTIGDAIRSVINQTYPIHEIIVVDDGSTDNSANFVSEHFPMVTLIKQANMGVSKARNVGIQSATGKWVAFVDADDIWLPDKLRLQFEELKGCQWSHTNSYYFGFRSLPTVTSFTTLHPTITISPVSIWGTCYPHIQIWCCR